MSKPYATESRALPLSIAIREEADALTDDTVLADRDHDREMRARGFRGVWRQGVFFAYDVDD